MTNSLLSLSTFQPRGSETLDLLGKLRHFPAHSYPVDEATPSAVPAAAAPDPAHWQEE